MLFRIDESERAQRTAIIDGGTGQSWTFSELSQEVEGRAAQLRERPRGLVLAFCRNDYASVLTYLAAIEAGHAVALLSDRLAPALRAELVSRYRPDWIYTGQ